MKKRMVSLLITICMLLFSMNVTIYADSSHTSDVNAYQGIFMKDNIFLSIPLYTDWEPGSTAIGVVHHINKPTVDNYGYINAGHINTLGELHKPSDKKYYIHGNGSKYGVVYHKGYISVYSVSGADLSYVGDYIQVSNSGANMNPKSIWLNIPKKITVILNGSALSFDQTPIILNDRTMVPMRTIFESLGYKVNWNQSTKTVTATGSKGTIVITIGADSMSVNGKTKYIDSPAMIYNDRTLVPVRAIGEASGCNVSWDGNSRTVTIKK